MQESGFAYGIEHEVAFLNANGAFADFSNTRFEQFDEIIADLPTYEQDYPQLRIGDVGIKKKRWYIEGFERFDEDGAYRCCIPKGVEIRTTIHATIAGAIAELEQSYEMLKKAAATRGFQPILTSFNPIQQTFEVDPPLNLYEQQRRQSSPEKQTGALTMLTYGPDLNISLAGMSEDEAIEIGKKLTYYSPFIVPFSFSSPFFAGKRWHGLSVRTYYRTWQRPAALVFVADEAKLIASQPSLTKKARLKAEIGRIEFKACDSCGDFALYAGLLALLKGMVRDRSLAGKRIVPDKALHQLSAQTGFANEAIFSGASEVLLAATNSLANDADQQFLKPLAEMLEKRTSPAIELNEKFAGKTACE